jgi:hypothetical protein
VSSSPPEGSPNLPGAISSVDTPKGLCDSCVFRRVIRSDRGSVFYMCEKSFTDPSFPKYPRLPVLQCAGYQAENRAS